jgi:hypothetical protein
MRSTPWRLAPAKRYHAGAGGPPFRPGISGVIPLRKVRRPARGFATTGAVDPQAFTDGRTRETAIRRDGLGRWWNGDDAITHPNLVRAFEGWIDRADDGRYCLKNDINWAYVTLEGPPFFVRAVRVEGGNLRLTLSGGEEELLAEETLVETPDGVLYAQVRGGKFLAQFDRSAVQALASWVGEDAEGPYLAVGDRVVRPRRVDVAPDDQKP